MLHDHYRRLAIWTLFLLGTLSLATGQPVIQVVRAAGPCDPPVTNPIVCENSKPGNPASQWDVSGSGDPSIQGFSTDISVNKGGTVTFKVNTDASAYVLNIYRIGYYGGMGARLVATVMPSAALPQRQPACVTNSTALYDCGTWALSASWAVPADAVSGVSIARLVRSDTLGASHVFFIVRDDSGNSPILFQTSDTTWQAYNAYGGSTLYFGTNATSGCNDGYCGRAYKVSYNRPFLTRANTNGIGQLGFFFNSEYPMVRWLESNGYNVSYFTGMDSDRMGSAIRNHKVFMSVGQDEYWSGGQRANVEAARAAGVNLAFFSGNDVFWKTRWENSIDGTNTPYRTLVSYKETHANAVVDPADPPTWTGTWRDPRFSPPADGGRPENALKGTLFTVNGPRYDAITVPSADGRMRFWRNTAVANLTSGQSATLTSGSLGNEWDEAPDNGSQPAGLIELSSTTVNLSSQYLLDYGSTFGAGTATHRLMLSRYPGGALVFGAGTCQWSWGLDGTHDVMSSTPDLNMRQAPVNLLADMGVQPGSLQPGLVAATASTDTTPPASTIISPASGSTIPFGNPITVSGTATDAGGGVVGGVEVSVDGGSTWHLAGGRGNWTYTFTPALQGQLTIKSRAVDDSGNLETPSAGVTVTVGTASTSLHSLNVGGGYAEAPDAAKLKITGDWTVEAWFKDQSTSGYSHNPAYLLIKGDTNVAGEAPYLIEVDWGSIRAGERTAWNNQVVSYSLPASGAGQWHHVAATLQASSRTLTLYLDGVQVAQGTLAALTTIGNSLPLDIGRDGSSGNNWVGKIDDVRIWNLVRTASQIGASYQNELGAAPAGLAANYRFDESSGSTAADSTPSPDNATLFSGATFSTDVGAGAPPPATPPVISNVQASGITSSTATITWSTDQASNSQVDYGTSTSYGFSVSNSASVTSHSVQLTGLSASTLYHYRVDSTDAAGTTSSGDFTLTTAAPPPPPVISNVQSSAVTNSSATITWSTDQASTSQVDYGTTTAYGSSTTLDPSLVTSHTVQLSGLSPGTTYHYRVDSTDAGGTTSSGDFTFTTTNAAPQFSLALSNGGYAEATNANKLNPSGDWTVEAWFKDESPSGYNHPSSYLLIKGDTNVSGEAIYLFDLEWGALLIGERTGWSNQVMRYVLPASGAGSWHHIAASLQASSRTLTIYLDGVQVAQGTLSALSLGNVLPLDIGRDGNTGNYWNGKIDDVRIWNVVRTASQISANYQSELSGPQTGLVANWKFDDGSGATAMDSTSAPDNASLLGGATFSSDTGAH